MRSFKRRVGQGLSLKSRLSGVLQELACWGGVSSAPAQAVERPSQALRMCPLSRILVTLRAWLMVAS